MARKKITNPTPPTSALDELEAWVSRPSQDTGATLSRWVDVAKLVSEVASNKGGTPVDPFLLPLA